MRNPLANAAERVDAVLPARSDEQEIGFRRRFDERIDRLCSDHLRARMPPVYVVEVDSLPTRGDDAAERRAEALRELRRDRRREVPLCGSVDADHQSGGKASGIRRTPRDQDGAGRVVNQRRGRRGEHDPRRAAVPVRPEAEKGGLLTLDLVEQRRAHRSLYETRLGHPGAGDLPAGALERSLRVGL